MEKRQEDEKARHQYELRPKNHIAKPHNNYVLTNIPIHSNIASSNHINFYFINLVMVQTHNVRSLYR